MSQKIKYLLKKAIAQSASDQVKNDSGIIN